MTYHHRGDDETEMTVPEGTSLLSIDIITSAGAAQKASFSSTPTFAEGRAMAARSHARIREHYELEKGLARQLRCADKIARGRLYTELYDELFSRLPDHPQVVERGHPEVERRRVRGQLKFLEPLLCDGGVYLELGAGVGALARQVAALADFVYAVDVSRVITASDPLPHNMAFVLSDGTSVPVPPESVDVAFSNQLMEHLHPDDALEQLANVYAAIKPGGIYFCITPSRLSGPHDVSRHFDEVAAGFHLKEYTYAELEALFRQAGFRRFTAIVGYRGYGFRCGLGPVRGLESTIAALPRGVRRRAARIPFVRLGLGIKLLAEK